MFGGLAFLFRGRMCCGIVGRDLMVRIPGDEFEAVMGCRARETHGFHGQTAQGIRVRLAIRLPHAHGTPSLARVRRTSRRGEGSDAHRAAVARHDGCVGPREIQTAAIMASLDVSVSQVVAASTERVRAVMFDPRQDPNWMAAVRTVEPWAADLRPGMLAEGRSSPSPARRGRHEVIGRHFIAARDRASAAVAHPVPGVRSSNRSAPGSPQETRFKPSTVAAAPTRHTFDRNHLPSECWPPPSRDC